MKLIKKILRAFLIIVMVCVGVIIGGIAVIVPWPTMIKIKIQGECPSEIVDGQRNIAFVGYTLVLPDELITSCFAHTTPDLGGRDPASVTLDAELPDFAPLQDIEWPKIYKSDDQVRIAIYGYDVSDKDVVETNNYGIEKSLERLLLRKNRDGNQIYAPSEKEVYGLEHYVSDKSIPIYNSDTFIARAENGGVEFYLQCFENKEKHHRYWNCNSNDFVIKPGVSYRYYFNSQHLPHARKINKRIQSMVKIEE